jgi:hypothetical protein
MAEKGFGAGAQEAICVRLREYRPAKRLKISFFSVVSVLKEVFRPCSLRRKRFAVSPGDGFIESRR